MQAPEKIAEEILMLISNAARTGNCLIFGNWPSIENLPG
jgi:hypothetical protein